MFDDLRFPYQPESLATIQLGGIIVNEKLLKESPINLLLKTLNRHGLIAGATGSGKTKTMQVLCEQLSLAGIPSFVMDIKGDISGLATPGQCSEAVQSRCESLGLEFTPRELPSELFTLNSQQPGVPLRTTVKDFGSILFARMLDLNDTQTGVLSVIFQYALDEQIPLITLDDLKSILQFAQNDEGQKLLKSRYGSVANISLGTILRLIIELETQGGQEFFGEPAFSVSDLIRTNNQGLGVISILRLLDMQDKPKLFSTFMLKLLSDVYKQMPEIGDPEKPKLVFFIDESHLIFNEASKALLNLLDTMVKLIRSKGIGLIFCTQIPNDIPENILSQLGLKIQHSLRAFTAKDRKEMKLVAQNFPPSEHYQTEQLLTALGIGEALLCALNAQGQPTPLVQCRIRAPETRMGILTLEELNQIMTKSSLYSKYQHRQKSTMAKSVLLKQVSTSPEQPTTKTTNESSGLNTLSKNILFRQIVRQIARDLLRTLMTVLGIKKR